MHFNIFILVLPCLFSSCLCEITEETKTKLLTDFINYYNLQPNHDDHGSDGYLQSIREIDPTIYRIEVSFSINKDGNRKMMKCSATVKDIGEQQGIALVNNDMSCSEIQMLPAEDDVSVESVEVQGRKPVKLENEVQADTAITSGEQFIAIPRDQPSAPCIGCSSHVNPQAAGVKDLADLGVRHLDLHEPSVKHSLDSVIDVERQVQVVNGVRYILILSINFDNCTEMNSSIDICTSTETCKISILVKPWQTLPSGAKYRAILSNNCTEEWQFGDNGEVLPEPIGNNDHKERDNNASTDIDNIKVEKHEDVQSQPKQEKTLTIDEIKAIEDQILPHDHINQNTNINNNVEKSPLDNTEISKDHIVKIESGQRYSDNIIPVTDANKHQSTDLSQDKRKAIDEMLDFLNFSGFKPNQQQQTDETIPRVKRSYDNDLQLLSLTEEYREIKKSIENAKYIYEMAQAMVDYLNEIDMEVKNRAVKNVIKAEEEEENDKRFVYIQAQVVIPCSLADCDIKKTQTKICNGVIDSTNKKNPQILNTFCYIDTKDMEVPDNVKDVSSDDPVLLRLTKEVLKKIESESTDSHAIKIKKILAANTRLVSGRVTKISMVVERIDCNKTVPMVLRTNCSTLQKSGSNVCEVIVYEKHWSKEKKISYTCTERPIDMTISNFKQSNKNITVDDPTIVELLDEAIQYLEIQSDKKYKQKIVNINKISTQIIAGFLINIEIVVGYTNCTNVDDLKPESNKCELLRNERLRRCKVQIWDRSWIVDGRQMEVSCDENENKTRDSGVNRKKRSLSFVGGETQQDVSDPKFKKLAEESLQNYLQKSSSQQNYKIVKIERVTVQLVSGIKTKIDFVISPINCSSPSSDCSLIKTDNLINCHATVLEQSWVSYKEYSVKCAIDNQQDSQRVKRGILGGEVNKDPSEPKYLQLALESLHKYVSDSGSSKPHKLVKVESVTTQVVAGTMTRIQFVAQESNNPKGDTINCNSEIWEQPWLNKKDISVSCQNGNRKNKRDVVGGRTEQDPSDPKYLQLALESLQKYVSDSGNLEPHKVVEVKSVTTQVVAGTMTRIQFVAQESNNPKGDTIICNSEIWEQPWLNKKDISVSCQNGNRRNKRDVVGGRTEQDPSDPKYLQLALESLQKYVSDSGNLEPHKVVEVKSVTTQVVAGTMTRIQFVAQESNNPKGDTIICNSEIWEQPWLNKKDISVSCQNGNRRNKRDVVGGRTEQDPSDPKYLQLALESLQKYVSDSGNLEPHEVVEVKSVTTQVVAGTMTRIQFVAQESNNPKGDTIICNSEIWEQPWLNKKDISVSCQNGNRRNKRDVVGGRTEQDPSDPKYLQLALESLQKYVSNSGNLEPHKVVEVKSVTTQVVAGTMTRIQFVAQESNNPKGDTIICNSEIWEQPWLNKKDISVSCQNGNRRNKRDVVGGRTEQDPSDPKYLQLALESLQKYVSDSGNLEPHKVVEVKSVTTQVVAGTMTRIQFVAQESNNPKGDTIICNSEIWEQPWLNKKDISVSCQNGNRRNKRDVVGGRTEQDPSDPKYLQLALESLQKYVSDSGNLEPHEVVEVKSVTTQVVAGIMTSIQFVARESNNPKSDTIICNSEIWEQPWLNKKDISVSCQNGNRRNKRDVVGGRTEQDPSDPKYLQLALESLQKYVSDSGNLEPHEVVEVKSVTTQVVAGTMTRIQFVAQESNNPKGDTIICNSEIWEQPWLNKKDISVSCQNGNRRNKRDVVGGRTEQDPSDPKYLQLALESLQKYVSDSGNLEPHEVVEVKSVTTQVVAGIMTSIQFVARESNNPKSDTIICNSEIWEQPWLNKKDISVSCQNGNRRNKRDVVGGRTEQDPSDPKYLQLALESLQKYVSDSGNLEPHEVVEVKSVTTQVVAGTMTRIQFVAQESNNPKGDTIICNSEIWEQPWLNKKDISVSCQNGNRRNKRDVVGGRTEQDPSDPKYLQLALESLQKYVSDSGNLEPHKVVEVKSVTTQVVAGTMTRIQFVAQESNNPKGDTIICNSEIWEQPWLNKKDISVSCQNGNRRNKRDVVGGRTEQDPSDPKYLQLALESLQKYVSDSGNLEPHKVVEVKSVTTQVVAGTMTRIQFVAQESNNPKGDTIICNSEIWEQPWLNKKDISVSCQNGNRRNKRDVVGGRTEQDPSDPKYLQLALESLQKYVSDSGNLEPHEVVEVKSVTTQVVAGTMTSIQFVAQESNNPKSDTIICNSEIWEQPWLNKKDISVSCQNGNRKNKRDVVGGRTEQDPSDPKYLQLALESLQKYVSDSGNLEPHKVVEVKSVTTQVVAGTMTRIQFVAQESNNPKGDTIICNSEIWEQPWLNKKDISVSCQNGNRRNKRDVVGGRTEQDPSDPKYLQLALESLQKYVSDSGNLEPHEVVEVKSVTTQVVAGTMTSIQFVAQESNNPKGDTIICNSEIWEQPWLNKKDISVSCQNGNRRNKRDVVGGRTEQDPSDPKYLQLALESLQKYVSDSGNLEPHEVVEVKSVTTQVVAGTMTRIQFVAQESNNPKGDTIICNSEIWEQPWLNKKDISVSCQNGNRRNKRDVVGGRTEQDPSDPKYLQLALESLQKYVSDSGNLEPHEVVEVKSVTTQVVAGTMTRIQFVAQESNNPKGDTIICNSEIWEQPWLNKKDISVSCQNGNRRNKRDVVGGRTEQDPSDPKYLQLALESLQKYVSDSGNLEPHKVVEVKSVTTQVVAGTMTRIQFVAQESNNPKGDTIICNSEIWEQPWLNKKDISVSCQNGNRRNKRDVVGGRTEQDPSDPKYLQLALESLQKYVSDSGNLEPHKVVEVKSVTTQVVAGTMTRIQFVAQESNNLKGDTIICNSEIWEQPWLNKKDISVSCQNGNRRNKRDVVGGRTEQDPSDPKYLQLALESLQKYVSDSGNLEPHKVVEVKSVTTQVVAGTMTRIQFVAQESNNLKGDTIICNSEIWEQPWLNKKDISVSCQNGNRRNKRDVVGGRTEQDPSDPKYLQLALESLQKYVSDSGNLEPHKVVEVKSVTTQVVAGTMTRIQFVAQESNNPKGDTIICNSEIWEQPWLNKKDISVSCQNGNRRNKRDVVGGRTEQDPSDPKYLQLALESLQKYVSDSGNLEPHEVVEVKSVTTQVVAGTMTSIQFVARESNNPKSDTIICNSEIWEQPWLNKKDISVSCQNGNRRNKRDVVNRISEKNPSDPKYHQIAEESLQKYLTDVGDLQPHKVVRVEKVTVQFISGLLTRLNFVALPIDTAKSDILNCYAEVLEKPQYVQKSLKVSCQYENRVMNTKITGGITKGDPNDPKYLKLADESLKKYLTDSDNRHLYKIVRIDEVTTQVVSGFLTRINFVVTNEDDPNAIMNCISEILEKDSPDEKKMHVICESDLDHRRKRYIQRGYHNDKMKNNEEEQDITKPEYQLLATQALRKFSKRKGIFHKVIEMKHVTMRVVSGMIYKIDFTASPTECLFNVSSLHARRCKIITNTTYDCHTQIWDQPWLRKQKINIGCYKPLQTDYYDSSDDEKEESDTNETPKPELHQPSKQDLKVYTLAEEALEQFLTSSNRKYVFRILKIHSYNEFIADGKTSKIEFSIAPTLCLREGFTDRSDTCEFKNPIVEYYCNAKIHEQAWISEEKTIVIHCKKLQNNNDTAGRRSKRQIGKMNEDDNEIDEDTTYYYADRAVHHLNEHSDTNNLYKLITIHAVRNTIQMKAPVVKMFIEVAETYCLRQNRNFDTSNCDEMEGLNHRLCLAKLFPSSDDELVVRHVTVICDENDHQFGTATGLFIPELLRLSILELEKDPERHFKLVHQGEPQVIPSLDVKTPIQLNFIIAMTNCSKDADLSKNPFQCYLDSTMPSRSCTSRIWLDMESKTILRIEASCSPEVRRKRAALETSNGTVDESELNRLMLATLEKLEMASIHRYKQRVLHINSYSSKITSGRVTTIDFDVAYTSCLKYEWIENSTNCDFLEHLPRRHCVAQIWERLWINNGMNIDVSCEDDETPLEAHVEFESAEMANQLAQESLKHIEAKYPNPMKQKIVRIFSLEKQVVAGIHYRMKLEVGLTDCLALSDQTDCKLDDKLTMNKFCRVNVWVRPWTDHPPNFRVICDYQTGASRDMYHRIQAEHLFYNFLVTYNPSYVNDHEELERRFEIFKTNVKKIHEFNVHEKGTARYGVTRFADLTYEEFSSRYMGLKTSLRDNNQPAMEKASIPNLKPPQNFDWRQFGAVTEVKDQGECGNSWAFSVTGNIESQWKIKSEKLSSLSEQQLLDCDKVDNGCSGGLPENAYRVIKDLGGMETDDHYPYQGESDKCLFNQTLAKVRVSGAVNITSNETAMAQWLVFNGPISIGLNGRPMQFYLSGVAHPWQSFCNQTELNHAALIVGYDVKDYPVFHKKIPYWIVKNSWGSSWGEQGYYLIHRGDNTCGVNNMATSAVLSN